VILIWIELALAFRSLIAGGITAIYVIPAYLLYMRREEEMMISALGERYERYRDRVGMLVPRLRGRA
jgi:protein-S-isoprenylcysteine O-methyltransferase Ste14